jgi:hypothetical protein
MSGEPEPRNFAVWVTGFDFDVVHVRAHTRGRATFICARAFADAGFGSVADGFRHIRRARLVELPECFRLVGTARDGEGLLYAEGS